MTREELLRTLDGLDLEDELEVLILIAQQQADLATLGYNATYLCYDAGTMVSVNENLKLAEENLQYTKDWWEDVKLRQMLVL